MKIIPLLINSIWLGFSVRGALRFRFAIRNTEKAQRKLLKKIIKKNRTVWYGQKYNFNEIDSYEKFKDKVPIVSYSEIEPLINRIAKGEKNVLNKGIPLCFEPTSGSSSKSKLIPYTTDLQKDFQNSISPWITNMFLFNPSLLVGRSYWSISPSMHSPRLTEGGIPVGFESDLSYLHPVIGKYYSYCVALPLQVSRLTDIDVFRYCTAAFLLAAKDLSFVSVWNPTFFLLILSLMEERWEEIADNLDSGTLSLPNDISASLFNDLQSKWFKNSKRASEIREVFKPVFREGLSKVWPNLKVISCWADGAASGPSKELADLFPNTKTIPKGLLATESFVSIPIEPYRFPILSVTSHFFEFVSSAGEVFPAWDINLKEGEKYTLVVTNSGGLYRYNLGDTVEIVGFAERSPMISFVGRSHVSDLYGEKLHEAHIAEIVKEIFKKNLPFVLLAPGLEQPENRYILYVTKTEKSISVIRSELEEKLCTNPHYKYCRQLRQLLHVEVVILPITSHEAHNSYLRIFSSVKTKAGDIKPCFLEKRDNWYKKLVGRGCEVL